MFKHDLGDGAELRMLEMRHAAEFLEFVEENREHLAEWLPWARIVTSLETAQEFIRRGVTRYAEDGLPWVGIWQDGQMAGGILFFPLEERIRATDIGYWLGHRFTGRGLATRSARAMLGFVFEELKLNRVGLQAEVDNLPSRAVADRLGFTYEGVRRQGWLNGDKLVDAAVYSLLASEWQEKKGQAK
jgi:ribosomal-protein-serine acetyltransferase